VAGNEPQPLGAVHPQIAPYGESFVCACGQRVVMAVGNDRQFAALCGLLGHPEWAVDVRFATNPKRVSHRTALTELLASALSQHDAKALLMAARKSGVPIGKLNLVSEALDGPTGRAMTASFTCDGHAVQHVRQVAFRVHRNGNRST